MKIEFLGTGGAITTPNPGCNCQICSQARLKGIPYSRTGPSLFIHGPNVLIDTPEEIKQQLNRSEVKQIDACFYSHWHPDHVMGRRVWEMNHDWRQYPAQDRQTDIYLPQQVAIDFRQRLGTWDHLAFLQESKLIRLIQLMDGEDVTLNTIRIKPFRLAEDYVYAFLFEGEGKRVLVVPDELCGWDPTEDVKGVDLAILPMGVVEFNPFTKERIIPENHPVLKCEATFQQTLEVVKRLNAKKVVLTHIEEPDKLGYDDLCLLEKILHSDGLGIEFAYDTLMIDV
ncbi:MAG: MBL fold metallo-hydrolase [Anaerolineaceae bacterium]|nr:MBL fold metallo-hydrolase [Anaerolineaceae bacterium]